MVSAAQSTFRTCGKELLSKDDANEADAMIEICVQMNRAILKVAERVCPCPAFAGCYNEALGTVCYVNAGHTPALLRDQAGSNRARGDRFTLRIVFAFRRRRFHRRS